MAGQAKFQTARIKQQSAFLELPGEIRTFIYRAALVKHTPIDLWPNKNIENNLAHPDLVARLKKSLKDTNVIEHVPVRHQADLYYVRKEMATGILATCKQVNMEARNIFWCENSFRFSGDYDWRGLRRFLVTIGREARSRIRNLDVCPPGWLFDQTLCDDNNTLSCGIHKAVNAKNHPKTHMSKLFAFGAGNDQQVENLRFISHMLRSEQNLRSLNLIIPHGWSFRQIDEPDEEYPNQSARILFDLQMLRHICTVSVILESGSVMLGLHNRDILKKLNMSLVAQPGTRLYPDQPPFNPNLAWPGDGVIPGMERITNLTRWDPPPAEDFLSESFRIFDQTDSIEMEARGGRTHKSSCYGRKKMERRLKGFGGCRFVERHGLYCNDCNQRLPDPWRTWSKHKYWCLHCKSKSGYTQKDGIEVRKFSREMRVARGG